LSNRFTHIFEEIGYNWNVGTVEQRTAISLNHLDDTVQLYITDPPYYDAIPYADLSDFFYVWLKRTLINHYGELLSENLTSKEEECIVDEIKG